jgi:hypothetical protein
MNDNSNKIPVYLFKGKPLQNKFNNDYKELKRLRLYYSLENDFDNGILSASYLAKHNLQ